MRLTERLIWALLIGGGQASVVNDESRHSTLPPVTACSPSQSAQSASGLPLFDARRQPAKYSGNFTAVR